MQYATNFLSFSPSRPLTPSPSLPFSCVCRCLFTRLLVSPVFLSVSLSFSFFFAVSPALCSACPPLNTSDDIIAVLDGAVYSHVTESCRTLVPPQASWHLEDVHVTLIVLSLLQIPLEHGSELEVAGEYFPVLDLASRLHVYTQPAPRAKCAYRLLLTFPGWMLRRFKEARRMHEKTVSHPPG